MNVTKDHHPTLEEIHKPLHSSHDDIQADTAEVPALQANMELISVLSNEEQPPNQAPMSSSDLESRLNEAEKSLENERMNREKEQILHGKAINYFQEKLKNVEEQLKMERTRHQRTRLDLAEKDNYASHQRQLMLDAVGELNRFLRGNQVPNQLADDEIIQKAMILRIEIRNFAIHHFEGNINQLGINQGSFDSLNEFLRISPDCLKSYIATSSTRVNTIRALLWAYLLEKVFNQFSWTWRGAGTAFRNINGFLDDLISEKASRDSQAKRKLHTWRASTAALLVEAMLLDEAKSNSDCQQLIQQWSNHISQLLEPFRLSRHQGYEQELEGIISLSLELDKDICKQIANIEWVTPEDLPSSFVPEMMELEPGQQQEGSNDVVTLVLGPGLDKYGKSSGDKIDVVERLLKMQVFYDKSLGDNAEHETLS
ncbi:hypothetical protein F5Y09DRAFT_307085 [Xylaria sp. FL1042]|nr:hypothetical protein F5Y09DRAFT_307085 [Xylaria sp. FL1042]